MPAYNHAWNTLNDNSRPLTQLCWQHHGQAAIATNIHTHTPPSHHPPVVGPQDGLDRLCGLLKVVVGDLGEQVVGHVGADVVVDLVEDAIVPVQRGQATPQVAPLAATVPGQLLSRVLRPVVVLQAKEQTRMSQDGRPMVQTVVAWHKQCGQLHSWVLGPVVVLHVCRVPSAFRGIAHTPSSALVRDKAAASG
jgi:hypothetical protein